MTTPQVSQPRGWMLAARPKTLPAAAAPVVVGASVAISNGVFSFWPALAALLGALLLQIGANFANDVFDYKKGADTTERLGPVRVTQAGLLSPKQVMAGMWLTFGLAAVVGLYLVYVGGWPIVVIGLLSIICAIAYTGGPFPLGYNGLGDLFVFIFFGLVAVCGTYYVQALTVSLAAVWASVPVGLLATAILVVNNLRDINTDRAAGKMTLAVRLGPRRGRWEYVALIGFAYALLPCLLALGGRSAWVLLPLLTLPMALRLLRTVVARSDGEERSRAGLTLLLVDREAPGVTCRRTVMADSRNAANLDFDNVRVAADAVIGEAGKGCAVLEAVVDRARIAIAAEMMGCALEAFERTVAYLKQREQFGVPIGSFQALQHRAAQMQAEFELCRSVLLQALSAVDETPDQLPMLASLAKAKLNELVKRVTNEAVQMHGGIGVTDELEIGFFLKRARVTMQIFGDTGFHKDRYATLCGY